MMQCKWRLPPLASLHLLGYSPTTIGWRLTAALAHSYPSEVFEHCVTLESPAGLF